MPIFLAQNIFQCLFFPPFNFFIDKERYLIRRFLEKVFFLLFTFFDLKVYMNRNDDINQIKTCLTIKIKTMGFFNAMSSIGKMNNLLKETENQLRKISDLMQYGANQDRIQQEVKFLDTLRKEMILVLEGSAGARVATYTFLGHKTRSLNVIMFLNDTIQELNCR